MALGVDLRRRLKLNGEQPLVARRLLLDDARRLFHQTVLHAGRVADEVIHFNQIEDVRARRRDHQAVEQQLVFVMDGDVLLQLEARKPLFGDRAR